MFDHEARQLLARERNEQFRRDAFVDRLAREARGAHGRWHRRSPRVTLAAGLRLGSIAGAIRAHSDRSLPQRTSTACCGSSGR
jgi:hypothetical protein